MLHLVCRGFLISEDLEPSILFCGQMGVLARTTMVGFLASLAMKGDFCSINHKFLVRGHTYLPNDRDFAQVGKQKAVAQVHLLQDWIPYIQKAKKSTHSQSVP